MSSIRNPLHLEIIPSPGTGFQDFQALKERIDILLPFTESIHFDFLDGRFTNNSDFMDPTPFKEYAGRVILEAHFMTDNPLQFIKPFADAGFTRFIGQVEKMPDVAAFLAEAQLYGEAGLALDGSTPLSVLDAINLDDVDVIIIYTGGRAGLSGASMNTTELQKAMDLRGKDPFLPIEIDGGVNDTNILLAKDAGVTRFVSTGFIFSGNPEEQYEKLQTALS